MSLLSFKFLQLITSRPHFPFLKRWGTPSLGIEKYAQKYSATFWDIRDSHSRTPSKFFLLICHVQDHLLHLFIIPAFLCDLSSCHTTFKVFSISFASHNYSHTLISWPWFYALFLKAHTISTIFFIILIKWLTHTYSHLTTHNDCTCIWIHLR